MKKLSIVAALLFAFGTVAFAQDKTAAPADKKMEKKEEKKSEKKAEKKTEKADKKMDKKDDKK